MWFIVCVCASESITKNDVIKKKFLFDLANYQQHMIWIHPMTRQNGDMPSQFLSAAILVVLSDDNVENSDVLKHRFKTIITLLVSNVYLNMSLLVFYARISCDVVVNYFVYELNYISKSLFLNMIYAERDYWNDMLE